ncbi:uncharacterized protein LOC124936795 [Impatiens glandulifera]|uniref:uncharacterized protein LOC124936795 n=1 Tax=Impatiens glandulifera TaxID=253017 RepID=UPI001FB0CD65|nr:uncharacterized protein LOC124936795 [Impatiens glandulifera]
MEADEIINLFDSIWFSSEFFKSSSNPQRSSAYKENPYIQIQKKIARSDLSIPQNLILPSLARSKIIGNYLSPDSVLQIVFSDEEEDMKKKKKAKFRGQRKRGMTKSLSELEFEEMKGFMDLGFVFSEEDENSRLVNIIPGLKRSVNNKVDSVQRPYLSETWDEDLEKMKRIDALMGWKIPDFTNEMDMKKNLRKWARNVASIIR